MRIRKVKFVGVAAVLAATVLAPTIAGAADYPVLRGSQTEDMPPTASEVFGARSINWSGVYFGGGAGMARTKFDPGPYAAGKQIGNLTRDLAQIYRYQTFNNPVAALTNESGASYFGFAGYNAAFDDAVVGIEVDYTRHNHGYHGIGVATTAGPLVTGLPMIPGIVNVTQRVDDYASIRLRGGYAIGNFLPFASIGLAAGRGTSAAAFTPAAPIYPLTAPIRAESKNTNMYGITAGVGVDAALAENIFLRAEYLFTRFANFEGTVVDINNVRVGAGLKF